MMGPYILAVTIVLLSILFYLKSKFQVSFQSIGFLNITGIVVSTNTQRNVLQIDKLAFSPFIWLNYRLKPFSLDIEGVKLKLASSKSPSKPFDLPTISHTIPYLLTLVLNGLFMLFQLRILGLEVQVVEQERQKLWVRIESLQTDTLYNPLLLEAIDAAFDGTETKCFGITVHLDSVFVEDVEQHQVLETKKNSFAIAFTRNRLRNSKVAIVGVFDEWNCFNPTADSKQDDQMVDVDVFEVRRMAKLIVRKTKSFFKKTPRLHFSFPKLTVHFKKKDLCFKAITQKADFSLLFGSGKQDQIEMDSLLRVQGIFLSQDDDLQLGTIREVSVHADIHCECPQEEQTQITGHFNLHVNDPWLVVELDHALKTFLQFDKPAESPASKVKPHRKSLMAELKKMIDFQVGVQCSNANIVFLIENIPLSPTVFHFGTMCSVEQASVSFSTISVDSTDITIPRIDLHGTADIHSLKISTFTRNSCEYLFDNIPDLVSLLTIPSIRFSNTIDIFKNSIEASLIVPSLQLDLSLLKESNVSQHEALVLYLKEVESKIPKKPANVVEHRPDHAIFTCSLHLTMGSFVGLLESDRKYSLGFGFAELAGHFVIDDSVASQVSFDHIYLTAGSPIQPHQNLIHISSPLIVQRALGAVLQLSAKEMSLGLSLTKVFVSLDSILGLAKLIKQLKTEKEEEIKSKPPLQIQAKIPMIEFDFELPEAVPLKFVFKSFKIKSGSDQNFTGEIEAVDVSVIRVPQTFYSELGILSDVEFELNPSKDPIDIVAECGFSKLFVEHGWPMSHIVENFVNFNRAVKQTVFEAFDLPPPNAKFASGRTLVDTITFPNLIFRSSILEMIFADDPFEAKLTRNYLVAMEENASRLIREKEFFKKLKSRYTDLSREDYTRLKESLYRKAAPESKMYLPLTRDKEIKKAWNFLQEFNAQAYTKAIAAKTDHAPPLLHITMWGLAVNIKNPSFEEPLEVLLNRIDNSTPKDVIYDDLMPFQVKTIVCGTEIRLRDYKNPFLYLPNVGDTYCEMNGLIIIAEPRGKPECTRVVTMPLSCDPDLIIEVTRNVNPTKIYTETTTDISTLSTVQMCIGAPYEPALAEVINIIDNFTKVTDDPSPPVGWWDKLRIVLHGSNVINIHGSGQIRFRVLGSASPYFDPRKHYGVEGLECILSNGLEINVGGRGELTEMVVDCGELKMTFPRSFEKEVTQEDSVCLAKLTGGVKLILSTDFLTNSPKDPSVHIKPWVKHHEIHLQTVQSRRISGFVGSNPTDSFYGFRSHHISVKLEIQSPRNHFSGLSFPQNVLFLTKETMDGVEKIYSTYQSLLTNVPIKRGNLFNEVTEGFQKPKLGRVIDAVHLKAVLQPLLLSFTQQCEDGVEIVGVRMRAETMNVDAFFRQYDVKQVPDIQEELEKKAVTKWIRVESAISFLEIEGKVLSYCDRDSDLVIPGALPVRKDGDSAGWVFKEDTLFPDLSKLSMLPFLWTPRLDFLRLENSKQTSITEETSNRVIYLVQKQILEIRLREIDSMIWSCKNQIKILESRGMVFMDDSVKSECTHLMMELSLLHDKHESIKQSILDCENIYSADGEYEFSPVKAFDSKYIVHNVKLFWNVPVRNIIFRIVDVHTKNRALNYCLSNAAAQVASELVETVTQEQHRKKRKDNKSNLPSLYSPKDDAKDILKKLLKDLEVGVRLVIPCEDQQQVQEPARPRYFDGKTPDIDFKLSEEDETTHFESDVLVSLINPQIHFEVQGNSFGKSSVVVTAHRMQVKFFLQFDPEDASLGLDKDQQDTIISFRNIWSLDKAQFLVETNKDQFGLEKFAAEENVVRKGPRWVPIECVLNYKLPASMFARVIEKAVVLFQTDEDNPLYIQRANEKVHIDQTSTFRFEMPVLKVSSSSEQYLVFFDLFKNLLVYIDPASGERADRAKKMLLALEQCEDIQYYRFAMLSLQEKVKHSEYLLKYGKRGDIPLSPDEMTQAKKSNIEYRNDLYVLMEGLKNLQNIEMKKRSLNIAWQILVQIDHFNWLMLQDNQEPLCRWTIENLNFVWINNEDQSSVNTLEVDNTFVENLSHTATIFKDVISPYKPDNSDNYDKQKVIRVYWRENAPVAGIQVVDHFEINMHPLLIQMTYDFGKMVGKYLFPTSTASTDTPSKTTKPLTDGSDQKDRKTPFGFQESNQMRQMQDRANQNKSFIYIKVPGVEHCLSYRGSKEKNIEDLNRFTFFLPTLEYRNKTWTWYDFLQAAKKGTLNSLDALRAALANTGALVREKLFVKKTEDGSTEDVDQVSIDSTSPKLPRQNNLLKRFGKKHVDFNYATYMKSNLSAEDLAMETLEDASNPQKEEILAPTLALLQHKGRIIFGNKFVLQK